MLTAQSLFGLYCILNFDWYSKTKYYIKTIKKEHIPILKARNDPKILVMVSLMDFSTLISTKFYSIGVAGVKFNVLHSFLLSKIVFPVTSSAWEIVRWAFDAATHDFF